MKILGLMLTLAGALAAQVKLPPYTRQVLPNGAVIDLIPRRDVPLMTLNVIVRGGAESDLAGQEGLAAMTAELLRRGTAVRTADRFSEELETLGASFRAGADRQATIVGAEFLSKTAPRAIELIADAVLHPQFPVAEVKKAVAQRIDAVRTMKDNPLAAGGEYFRAFFYPPGHPYASPVNGDEISLAKIDRAAVAGYHKRQFAGANLIVTAAGDFDPAAMRPILEKAFGSVPKGEAYTWRKDQPPARGGQARLLLVDKPDLTQTYFYIGQPGIPYTHPDRTVLWIVNTLFGGRFTSMLNDELRVRSGLTYGARCALERDRMTGGIVISTYTRTDSTAKAIDLALDVLKRLNEKGIDAEQLASAKAYLKGTFPPQRLETADQIAGVVGELELYGLGKDEIDGLFAKIDAVTLEQANAAVKKYYRTDGLAFVLLGNASRIREAARKYATEMREMSLQAPGFRVR